MTTVDASADKRRELKRRIFASLALAPVALGLAWLGGPAFTLMLTVCAVIIFLEWRRIVGETRWAFRSYLPLAVVAAAGAAHAFIASEAAWLVAGLGVLLAAAISMMRRLGPWLALGAGYACVFLLGLADVRSEGAAGVTAVFWLLLTVWSADTFAYFTGRAVGGPKLWPRVSPSKTWSGALGGLGGALVVGLLFSILTFAGPIGPFLAITAVLAVVSMGGDLLESSVKRRFDVKDAGHLIPGHGGLMDRADSLVAAAVFCVLIGLLRGLPVPDAVLLW